MKNELDQLVKEIEKLLKDKKAEDVATIDVRERTPFAEYYIISTALNNRHIKALIEEVEERLDKLGVEHKNIEGTVESGWMLIDANGVVINVFSSVERERFSLDKLLLGK